MNRNGKILSAAGRVLALLGALCVGGCAGGPERTPKTPVKGVDTETNEVTNEGDDKGPGSGGSARAPTGRAAFLGSFVGQIASAHEADPGVIAVFPAISRTPNSSVIEVTSLGDFLMEETADSLEVEGIPGVLAGADLVNELAAANRGLDSLKGIDDVYALGDRIGAKYVVFGTADARTFDRLGRDQNLQIRWTAKRIADRETVASYNENLRSGSLAQSLYRYYEQPGNWQVGAEAKPFKASVQLEARILGHILAREIATQHNDNLRGRSVRIDPTVVSSRSGERAQVQEFAAEVERRLREAQQELAADPEAVDLERTALRRGPVTIQGQEYASVGDAVDAYRAMRNKTQTTAVGDLETDIAASLSEELREAMDGKIKLLIGDDDRDLIMNVLRREARASRMNQSVDPAMLVKMRTNGTQILILSTLRLDLDTYKLRATMIDVNTGEKVPHSVDFDPMFNDALNETLNR